MLSRPRRGSGSNRGRRTVAPNRLVEVGQGEAEHAARLEHPPKLSQHRQEIGVRDLRQRMNADGVVDAAVLQRQPLADVAD